MEPSAWNYRKGDIGDPVKAKPRHNFLSAGGELTRPCLVYINLVTDPKEREPFNPVYLHTWPLAHFGRLMKEFALSVQREPLIPAGAPLDFVPKAGGKQTVASGKR